jgi:hypothetical protein
VSPKSGSPGSVVAPADPAKPHEADKADPTDTSEAKARQREAQRGKYGSQKVEPFKPGKNGQDREKKTAWIEIELVGEDGEPIAGEAYRITLADGTVASGSLDEKGLARLEGIEPGTCKITFPNLDQEAWVKA